MTKEDSDDIVSQISEALKNSDSHVDWAVLATEAMGALMVERKRRQEEKAKMLHLRAQITGMSKARENRLAKYVARAKQQLAEDEAGGRDLAHIKNLEDRVVGQRGEIRNCLRLFAKYRDRIAELEVRVIPSLHDVALILQRPAGYEALFSSLGWMDNDGNRGVLQSVLAKLEHETRARKPNPVGTSGFAREVEDQLHRLQGYADDKDDFAELPVTRATVYDSKAPLVLDEAAFLGNATADLAPTPPEPARPGLDPRSSQEARDAWDRIHGIAPLTLHPTQAAFLNLIAVEESGPRLLLDAELKAQGDCILVPLKTLGRWLTAMHDWTNFGRDARGEITALINLAVKERGLT